jgi:hypothetical protein
MAGKNLDIFKIAYPLQSIFYQLSFIIQLPFIRQMLQLTSTAVFKIRAFGFNTIR